MLFDMTSRGPWELPEPAALCRRQDSAPPRSLNIIAPPRFGGHEFRVVNAADLNALATWEYTIKAADVAACPADQHALRPVAASILIRGQHCPSSALPFISLSLRLQRVLRVLRTGLWIVNEPLLDPLEHHSRCVSMRILLQLY